MKTSKLDAETLHVSFWQTPATAYPVQQLRSARIVRKKQKCGVYRMEGIDSFKYYKLTAPIDVTALKIYGSVWMVDDPLHWHAMRWYLQQAAPGVLRCAGLGLGLCAHIASSMQRFTKIEVIEINKDVIDLVAPLLPKDARIEVIHADFENFKSTSTPDCILWDLAAGEQPETVWQLARGIAQTSSTYPETLTMYFGLKSKTGSAYAGMEDLFS